MYADTIETAPESTAPQTEALATIMLGSSISVQGVLVQHLPGDRAIVRLGTRLHQGTLVR